MTAEIKRIPAKRPSPAFPMDRKLVTAQCYSDINILAYSPKKVMAFFRIPRLYIRQQLINQIQYLHNEGKPVIKSYVLKNHPNLLEWNRLAFTNWHTAVEEAGYDYDVIQEEARLMSLKSPEKAA